MSISQTELEIAFPSDDDQKMINESPPALKLKHLTDPLLKFFGEGMLPSPELNEIYELKLAKMEADKLSPEEILDRGAYFIGVNGEPTNHYRICTNGSVTLPESGGNRLRSFIGTHRFKTSYATHGLFPYRGKFHPQMIKAILNIIGAKPGHLVLDPMAGSGTTAIEASLMGIDSVSVDLSPFCTYMTKAKIAGLSEDIRDLLTLSDDTKKIKELYQALANKTSILSFGEIPGYRDLSSCCLNLLGLAFMDARGYSARSKRKSEFAFFCDILSKYAKTIDGFQRTWNQLGKKLGKSTILKADASALPLESESMDGVVFSPPYSFAIDYVKNDKIHLDYLKCDAEELKGSLVGLRGSNSKQRVLQYFEDMNNVISEVARVLKKGRYCAIVVGSNSNQLAKALGLPQDSNEARYGIESRLISFAEGNHLNHQLAVHRLIVGMANTMREEHILFFRKAEQ